MKVEATTQAAQQHTNLEKGTKVVLNHNYLDEKAVNATDAAFVEYNKDKSKGKFHVAGFFRWYPVANIISVSSNTQHNTKQTIDDKDDMLAKQTNTTPKAPVMTVVKGGKSDKAAATVTNKQSAAVKQQKDTAAPSAAILPGKGQGAQDAVLKAVLKTLKPFEAKENKTAFRARTAVELLRVGANVKQLREAGVPGHEVSEVLPVYHAVVLGASQRETTNNIIKLLQGEFTLKDIAAETGYAMTTVSKTATYYKLVKSLI